MNRLIQIINSTKLCNNISSASFSGFSFQISEWLNCNTLSRNFSVNISNENTSLLSAKTGTFQIFCIDENGTRSQHEITKSSLYRKFGLSIRDVRFQHQIMLYERNKKIIFRFQDLKILICPDVVVLIDPPFAQESDSENQVAKFWRTFPSLLTNSVLYTSNLPLEYRALEAIFMHVLCEFSLLLSKLEPEINQILSVLTDPKNLVVDRSLVHVLLKSSTRLNRFSTQLSEFCDCIAEILEYDDDIRAFCISSDIDYSSNRSQLDAYLFIPPTNSTATDPSKNDRSFELRFPDIHIKQKINLQDEMENLLDSYLKDVEEIQSIVKELKEVIDNSSTAILINLDSHRNLLLRFELELTIGMFCCTLFGLIGMAFGMNLESSFEEHPLAFWYLSGVMVVGSGVLWRILLNLSRKPISTNKNILKGIQADNFKSNISGRTTLRREEVPSSDSLSNAIDKLRKSPSTIKTEANKRVNEARNESVEVADTRDRKASIKRQSFKRRLLPKSTLPLNRMRQLSDRNGVSSLLNQEKWNDS